MPRASLLVFVLLCSAMWHSSSAQSPKDEIAIRKVATSWEHAWNGHDMNALASLFTEDADFVNVGARHWRGRLEIEQEHTKRLAQFMKSTWETKSVSISFLKPDVALAHVDWALSGDLDPDGTPRTPRGGVFTWVLKKQADQWLIRAAQNTNLGNLAPHPDHGKTHPSSESPPNKSLERSRETPTRSD